MFIRWEYFDFFYIFNFFLCLVYPTIRYCGLSSIDLKLEDTWGYKRENQIIMGIVTILILRYVRYFSSFNKYFHEVFFYIKCGTWIICFFIDYILCSWYFFACVVVWILFRPPGYKGPTNVIYIANEEFFKERVLAKKGIKNLDNAWLVIFTSNLVDDCFYTEELWAKLSLKYSTPGLYFAKIDVDVLPSIPKEYGIETSGLTVCLPYLVLFVNGEEKERYPGKDKKGRPLQVKCYREKDITKFFDLETIYNKTRK